MIDFNKPALKKNFLSEDRVLPLARYCVEQVEKCTEQSPTNDYSFPPTEEFMALLINDDNRELIEQITDKYHMTAVRLHCRPAMSVTDTHFDGGHMPTFGVCLSGRKLWSIKEATWFDLFTLHYGCIQKMSAHHTLDSMINDRSIWFHEKPEDQIIQDGSDLIYLPPGWYHTVLYAEDIISFSITLLPKDEPLKLREQPASFFYSPPPIERHRGTKAQWYMMRFTHHALHAFNHLMRAVFYPGRTILGGLIGLNRFRYWCFTKVIGLLQKFSKPTEEQKQAYQDELMAHLRARDQIILKSLNKFIESAEKAEAAAKASADANSAQEHSQEKAV